MAPERYDLVFDARGFPRELDPEQHVDISFIPTDTAVIRRCPAIVEEGKGPALEHTYSGRRPPGSGIAAHSTSSMGRWDF